jgi:ceramide glucosyltransferase
MDALIILFDAVALAGAGYLLVAAWAVRRFAARPSPAVGHRPPATVLKPLYGEDAGLAANLLSFVEQDYPAFQVVFGVRDRDDPAVGVVKALIAARPDADLMLVVDPAVRGANYKISNLENMLAAAKHDILVIADSDMRVRRDYLADVTAPLADPMVGLVTCLYAGRPAAGPWSRLGAMWVNYQFLPSAVLADRLGVADGCFGATMALRRETLEAAGGFAALRDRLADDHALGAAVRSLGKRLFLSGHVVDDVLFEPSAAALLDHEMRWARTIRSVAPGGYAASIVTHPFALALLAALAGGLASTPWLVAGLILLVRFAMVREVERALGLSPAAAWLVPLRDLLSFAVFLVSFCGRKIAWRDHAFRLEADGRLKLNGDVRP